MMIFSSVALQVPQLHDITLERTVFSHAQHDILECIGLMSLPRQNTVLLNLYSVV
jgi:hypothetical protein